MVQKLRSIFLFYRRYLVSSALANVLLLLMGISLPVSATIKICFFGFLLFIYLTTKQRNKLTFYQNLSISTYYLFGVTLLFDLVLLFLTYFLAGNVF